MSYSFAEASKDAERIENFLQRLAKAREIFKLVGDAQIRIEQLKATERTLASEMKIARSHYVSAKTLSDEKVKASDEVAAAAKAEAELAQKDARDIIGALAAEADAARSNAEKTRTALEASFEALGKEHRARVQKMAEVEASKRAQIAEADSLLREIVAKISPSGD